MAKEPVVKPWDRRAWPAKGGAKNHIFMAVGAALSSWEEAESEIAWLFSAYLNEGDELAPARRAFTAVRTFEARCEMLKAASTAYYQYRANDETQAELKKVVQLAACLSPRRNEIAHGFVYRFRQKEGVWGIDDEGFALFPSFASFKDMSIHLKPSYCMTQPETKYFAQQFSELASISGRLYTKIFKNHSKQEFSS